ncbi:glycosyltransferase [Agromyces atrinae]|uniref:Glycosyltransferase n=1 Tax=Agromyces atrinae TaxID=592376 RepID=A0A4Q2MBB4_9MICO|nr:glycosyltransferase [Agromyces atrinae]NYD66698.1 glycosyltransferase involved in cell wall biosynthesis [Agromyces atrinae]RXZ87361.1 glycosyltransferase [Agromyces atrinae]
MTSLLILSFSPIASDARVLKQVEAFRDRYTVTTCGYGPAPEGVAEHIRIPDDILHNVLHDGLITKKRYKRAYWSLWSVKWVKRALRRRTWDIVLANDVEAVPVALQTKPTRGVHADLHEYSPLLHEDWQGWRDKVTPFVEWQCSEYVAHAASWTTVGEGIADEYERNFGFRAEVVTNAAPYVDASPTPVSEPIALVHSGAAMGDRRLEVLIDGVASADADVTLDLYLTANQPAYLDELKARAQATEGRVRVNDPVPYSDLSDTLRRYDVGVHLLPPTNFNNRWALPNKLFDYVQARLGVIIGPTPEMANVVTANEVGIVADGFDAEDFARALESIDRSQVEGWKRAADEHAHDLSAESQVRIWEAAIARLAG